MNADYNKVQTSGFDCLSRGKMMLEYLPETSTLSHLYWVTLISHDLLILTVVPNLKWTTWQSSSLLSKITKNRTFCKRYILKHISVTMIACIKATNDGRSWVAGR